MSTAEEVKGEITALTAEFNRFKILSKIELDFLKRKFTKGDELLMLLALDKFDDVDRIYFYLDQILKNDLKIKGGMTVGTFNNIARLIEAASVLVPEMDLEAIGGDLVERGEAKKKDELAALAKKKKKQANRPIMRDGAVKGRLDGRKMFAEEAG